MNSYVVALLLIAGPLALIGRGAIERCAAVIILNWIAGYVFNETFGTFTPWIWSTIIDVLAASIILLPIAGRWQAVLAVSYILQIVCHFVYGINFWGQHQYWAVLTFIAWGQLLILGVWGCVRVLSHLDIRGYHRKANGANSKGMGQ
jgi:hypothetical protein